jgi:hypothetical protein
MIGGFVFNLFGGSKTRKVSRKKRGGKIVLDNQTGGKIILNKKKTKKLKGGKIVLANSNNNKNIQNGGHSSCGKLNQGGGQCGARKLNQNGGSGRGNTRRNLRRETPLPPQPGVTPMTLRRKSLVNYKKQNKRPTPWTRPLKGKKSGKKSKNNSGNTKSGKEPRKKSGKPAPEPQPPKKPITRRSRHSLAARAAAANKSLFN